MDCVLCRSTLCLFLTQTKSQLLSCRFSISCIHTRESALKSSLYFQSSGMHTFIHMYMQLYIHPYVYGMKCL